MSIKCILTSIKFDIDMNDDESFMENHMKT
jgi:hypothetical protein